LGDFNFIDISWDSLCGLSPSSVKFCDIIFNLNFSQLICEPTHIAGNVLDLILTNIPDLIYSLRTTSVYSFRPLHKPCEGISREHFKAIKSLSSLSNFVYYCQVNDCASRIKNITIEWVQSRVSPQIESVVSDISKGHLSTEFTTIQTAMTDLSAKIDNLQAQEQKLSTQIASTSNSIGKYPSRSIAATSGDRKSNVVVFGIEENTLRSARIIRDTKEVSKVFSNIDVHIEPSQVLDWEVWNVEIEN